MERVIRRILRKACPHDVILGEEYGADEEDGSRTWQVDSLCGTLNYAAHTPLGRGQRRPARREQRDCGGVSGPIVR